MNIVAVDIGGTHVRFALAKVEDGKVTALSEPVTMNTGEYASLQAAWEMFGIGLDRPLPRAAAIAVAGPINDDVIKLTNSPWIIRRRQAEAELGLDSCIWINDFAAVALAVGSLGPEHLRHIAGPVEPLPSVGVISIVGPGTGLGVAALVMENGRQQIMPTEGGHMAFAPLDPLEDAILARLRAQYARVSVERVVSGPGLATIYEALAAVEGRAVQRIDDNTLWAQALMNGDSLATAALDCFCRCLAAVSGDVALAHGSKAVVIAGGLGLRIADTLSGSGFSERFIAKGRHRALMAAIPVKLVTHSQPGLFGAATAFARERNFIS